VTVLLLWLWACGGKEAEMDSAETGDSSETPQTPEPEDPESQWFCLDPAATLDFEPDLPVVGTELVVSVTAPTGYVYVGMSASPPQGWTYLGETISGSGPFTWSYRWQLDTAGRYDFHFTADAGATSVCAGSTWAVVPF
jgi:hypothetical protein